MKYYTNKRGLFFNVYSYSIILFLLTFTSIMNGQHLERALVEDLKKIELSNSTQKSKDRGVALAKYFDAA